MTTQSSRRLRPRCPSTARKVRVLGLQPRTSTLALLPCALPSRSPVLCSSPKVRRLGHRRTLTPQRAAAATARVPRTSQGRAEWSVLHSAVAASGDVIAVAGDGRKDASPNLGSHSAGFYRLAARDLFPLQSMVIASPGATQRVACNVVSECTQRQASSLPGGRPGAPITPGAGERMRQPPRAKPPPLAARAMLWHPSTHPVLSPCVSRQRMCSHCMLGPATPVVLADVKVHARTACRRPRSSW